MLNIHAVAFDWDYGNKNKCQKHGVSLLEIETLFKQKKIFITKDNKHSLQEERLIAVGASSKNRFVFVGFTLRKKHDTTLIRPITARYMHEKEIQKYVKEFTRI